MTPAGRHEAPVRATDQWLVDQFDAWVQEFDAHTAHVMEGATRSRSESQTDVLFRIGWMLDEQGRLLYTVRQLVEEIRRRGGAS